MLHAKAVLIIITQEWRLKTSVFLALSEERCGFYCVLWPMKINMPLLEAMEKIKLTMWSEREQKNTDGQLIISMRLVELDSVLKYFTGLRYILCKQYFQFHL